MDDDCVPFPKEKLFFNVEKEQNLIEMVIDKISELHSTEGNGEYQFPAKACFGSAINNAVHILDGVGGRVLSFSS